jgi:hypothetical protein
VEWVIEIAWNTHRIDLPQVLDEVVGQAAAQAAQVSRYSPEHSSSSWKAKVPLAIVQRVLRHSNPATTSNIYGNIGLDDLRDAINVMGDQVRPHL